MPLTLAETPLYYKDSQGQYHRVLSGADMTGYYTSAEVDALLAAVPDVAVQTFDSDSITIAGKSVGNTRIPVTMTGYTPIGIVGIEKNGSGSSNLVFYEYKIEHPTTTYNYYNAHIYMRNTAESTTATVVVTAYVLFKRNI